jgi:hypothetical protein
MKNLFLFALMGILAFSACNKNEDEGFELKNTTLSLTSNSDGSVTTIEFTSATAFTATTDGTTITGTYTFTNEILTLKFSDKEIVLTKDGDTFKSNDYTVGIESGGDDPNGENPDSFDGSKIQAKVESGNDYNAQIDSVKLIIIRGDIRYEIASAKYANGGFTLNLPATVSDQYLQTSLFSKAMDMTVSDDNAQANFFTISAYKDGKVVGSFSQFCDFDGYRTTTEFIYVDRNVTLTSASNLNISLKKGWNKMYLKEESESGKDIAYTIIEPSGLKWYFKDRK